VAPLPGDGLAHTRIPEAPVLARDAIKSKSDLAKTTDMQRFVASRANWHARSSHGQKPRYRHTTRLQIAFKTGDRRNVQIWPTGNARNRRTGQATMNGTSRQSAAQRGERRPAGLADGELLHLENMVAHVTRTSAAQPGFDHDYWERRIRAVEDGHELVASQHGRIARLRERLTESARIDLARRPAA
jgi:hypothetical protein